MIYVNVHVVQNLTVSFKKTLVLNVSGGGVRGEGELVALRLPNFIDIYNFLIDFVSVRMQMFRMLV